MRDGQIVQNLTHEECMDVMFKVLPDPGLHARASEGYKKVRQSIDLHGSEDALVCREAGTYWNEGTTDNYPSMHPELDDALAAVAGEWESQGLVWSERDVRRLITPYPARPAGIGSRGNELAAVAGMN